MLTHSIRQCPPMILAGRKGTFPIGPSPGIKDLWAAFMKDFGRIEGQIGYKSYGLCFNFDDRNNMDYMAAVEVKDAGQVPNYLFTLDLPARKVAAFHHVGPIDTISTSWAWIFDEGLPKAKLCVAAGAQCEVYPEDLGMEGASTPIEIHIPVV